MTIMLGSEEEPVIDYGIAPLDFVNGLARVDVMGEDTLFALWRWKVTQLDGRAVRTREIVQNIVMPTAAVGPGIELTVATFGPRLVLPAAGYALRRLLM